LGRSAAWVIKAWWGERPLTQAGVLIGVVLVFWLLGANTVENMHRLGLTPGFAFLDRTAGFEIGESWIAYSARDSFGRAILVGLLNTIEVGALGCVLATVIGVTLGLWRLSHNLLLSRLVQAYIELVRNTPLLLQLFFWSLVAHALPPPRQAIAPVAGIFLTNRGIFVPSLVPTAPIGWLGLALAAAVTLAALLIAHGMRDRPTTGRWRLVAAAIAIMALIGGVAAAAPTLDLPALKGFNIAGGQSLSPEFAALLTGLMVNASAVIAEAVRAGIQAVPLGQWEAARALGLSRPLILRLVVLPQALRVIVPMITSAYVSLIKQSSLAVAIGFPDLVNVLNTTANQTGQALESILIMLVVYLTLSLSTSILMNVYNQRVALKGVGSG
jgi:general L-amino acid transport system permease protein